MGVRRSVLLPVDADAQHLARRGPWAQARVEDLLRLAGGRYDAAERAIRAEGRWRRTDRSNLAAPRLRRDLARLRCDLAEISRDLA